MASVEIAGLAKRYGRTDALHPIELQVRDGEFLALLGPSGSGKTTLLRLIAGFTAPSQGSIRIGSRDVSGLPPHRRNLGVVFQSYALFPHLTVRDNVAFGLRMRGLEAALRQRCAQAALDLVGLAGLADRLPSQISGGQQQRVALARAMVIEPDVLLLDEPLGALDLNLRKRMQVELKALHQRLGRTFIYVTHDQEEALTMADRVAVMNHGRLLQIGPPETVYDRPTSRFVAEFLGESNLLPGKVEASDCASVRFRCVAGLIPVELADGLPAGPTALAIRPERLRLEEEAAGCLASFEGRVEAIAFKGAWLSVRAVLSDETRIEALRPNDGRAHVRLPRVGEPVRVGFDPVDARLVHGP